MPQQNSPSTNEEPPLPEPDTERYTERYTELEVVRLVKSLAKGEVGTRLLVTTGTPLNALTKPSK